MKIDIFSHILPSRYLNSLIKGNFLGYNSPVGAFTANTPLTDLDMRFGIMDMFEEITQVLTLNIPAIEQIADPNKSVDLAKLANDELANLVIKYPDRFIAAIAVLPMNNLDASIKEIERAIGHLGLKGLLLSSPINDKPLDSPDFLPIYESLLKWDLPIWIHPSRNANHTDYLTENRSFYNLNALLGWPFETTIAMARLTYSGVLERYPKLKIITHHCGGTVPFLAGRIAELGGENVSDASRYGQLTKNVTEYLKMFYADTATYAEPSALMCGYDFFGAEHMLFGTDMPHSYSEPGAAGIRQAIKGINGMKIPNPEKQMIFETNAKRLLQLC